MKIGFPYSSQIASLERIEFKQSGAVRPMNEIVALGKTDGSLRKDGFVYAHLPNWRFATKPGTKQIHSASLASMPRALFFEPRSEVAPVFR